MKIYLNDTDAKYIDVIAAEFPTDEVLRGDFTRTDGADEIEATILLRRVFDKLDELNGVAD